jgi:hypothetical protein
VQGLGNRAVRPTLPSVWTDFDAPFLGDFLTASEAVVGAVLHQILSGGALNPTPFSQCLHTRAGLGKSGYPPDLAVRSDGLPRALLGDFLTAFKAVVGAVLHQILVSMICLESRVVPSGGSVTHRSSNGALRWGDGAMRRPSTRGFKEFGAGIPRCEGARCQGRSQPPKRAGWTPRLARHAS